MSASARDFCNSIHSCHQPSPDAKATMRAATPTAAPFDIVIIVLDVIHHHLLVFADMRRHEHISSPFATYATSVLAVADSYFHVGGSFLFVL